MFKRPKNESHLPESKNMEKNQTMAIVYSFA